MNPRSLFLTGVTGYVGAFLARELLESTGAVLHCLVRADDEAQGRARLREAMQRYRIWKDGYDLRIAPVVGDLRRPLLGLSDAEFSSLAKEVDGIYHCGAQVNFVFPYAALQSANVAGTQEVIRLSVRGGMTPLHHISSVDALLTSNMTAVDEDEPLPERPMPHGYVASKWAAEKVVSAVRAKGLPVSIYRPWLVGAHTETGVCHTTDYVLRVLCGCLEVGVVPDYDEEFNICPVDFFARALVRISLEPRWLGKSFHLANPETVTLPAIYSWLRSFGYRIEVAPYEEWRERMIQGVALTSQAYSVLPLIPKHPVAPEARHPRIDSSRTQQALAGTGITCPPLDAALAHRQLAYLVEIGFLPVPVAGRDREAARAAAVEAG